MIYSYGAKNYFSFKDGFDVSFHLNSKVPKSISKGKRFTPVLGIKGANASGKTALLKCLEFICGFATRSFRNEEENGIFVESFFQNDDPIDFYIDFETRGIRYIYELSCTGEHVIYEKIFKKVSRTIPIIERNFNKIEYRISDLENLDLMILKRNASIIDTIRNYKIETTNEDFDNIFNFLRTPGGNVSALTVMRDDEIFTYDVRNKFYNDTPAAFEFTKKILLKCDLGISDMKLIESIDDSGKPKHLPAFLHTTLNGKQRWFSFYSQSDGTRALYLRLGTYWRILQQGGLMVMDEFDTNLHPEILPLIVDLFLNEETNPNGAQFIFTSHNLEIIDHLGKYRTILVGKVDGESFCYRLDDIPGDVIRNDRQISSLYRDGKLGGVPRL